MPKGATATARAVETLPEEQDLEPRLYECCILYPNGLSQKDEQELLNGIEELFSEVGAKLVAKDLWGRRGLAYKIKGATEGRFVVYHYEIDPARVQEIDHALRIQKNALRHLLVKPPKHYTIVKFSELYEKWLKEREAAEEARVQEREEKRMEEITRKEKLKVQRAEKKKVVEVEKKPLKGEELTEQIEKLIADESIENL
jgi:ribosomal protein S6